MPAPRPTLPLAEDINSHDELIVRDAANNRRRLLVRCAVGLAGLAILTGVILGARPALHVAKAWQARRLARESERLTEAGDLEAARTKLQDALTIWQLDPDAMHAAAFYLTHVGAFHQALPYWRELEKVRPLTTPDLRDFTMAEIEMGDPDAAEALLRQVWPQGAPGTRADWSLGMQIALRRGRQEEGATLAKRLLDDGSTPARERLNAAIVILATPASGAEDRALAWKNVVAVATGERTPESLAALVMLAQQRTNASASQPAEGIVPPLDDLMAAIESHPLARTQHHLLLLDLQILIDPARKAELVQTAVDRFGGAKDEATLAALGAWLYGKGEFDKVLGILPLERAVGDRGLYLQHLDTLAALGRWREIRELVLAQKFPLDAMQSQMFLARCATQLGEVEAGQARWQAALDAAGTDPEKLLAVGQYAAKNGALTVAMNAYRAAVSAAPDSRAAAEDLVRLLESTGNTGELRAAVTGMAAKWPRDLSVRNDAAYLDALQEQNVPAARTTARELVQADPTSIAHRVTLALAELRLHNALAALDAFAGLDLANTVNLQPRQAAVYAATLWEASYAQQAGQVRTAIPVDRLLPEERELIAPIPDNGVAR